MLGSVDGDPLEDPLCFSYGARLEMDSLSSWDLSSENLRTMAHDLARSLDGHWNRQITDWLASRFKA